MGVWEREDLVIEPEDLSRHRFFRWAPLPAESKWRVVRACGTLSQEGFPSSKPASAAGTKTAPSSLRQVRGPINRSRIWRWPAPGNIASNDAPHDDDHALVSRARGEAFNFGTNELKEEAPCCRGHKSVGPGPCRLARNTGTRRP